MSTHAARAESAAIDDRKKRGDSVGNATRSHRSEADNQCAAARRAILRIRRSLRTCAFCSSLCCAAFIVSYLSVYPACSRCKYCSHLFPTTLPQVKQRTGMIIRGAATARQGAQQTCARGRACVGCDNAEERARGLRQRNQTRPCVSCIRPSLCAAILAPRCVRRRCAPPAVTSPPSHPCSRAIPECGAMEGCPGAAAAGPRQQNSGAGRDRCASTEERTAAAHERGGTRRNSALGTPTAHTPRELRSLASTKTIARDDCDSVDLTITVRMQLHFR